MTHLAMKNKTGGRNTLIRDIPSGNYIIAKKVLTFEISYATLGRSK